MTPDLDFLFLSAKHKEAISCMEFGVMEDIGIILLTGEIGTGKTTLIRHILQGIENNIDVATIYNTKVSVEELLATIMQEYGLDSKFSNKAAAVNTLQAHLRSLRSLKRKPLLIIDDAQNLSQEALEEIKVISNLQNSVRLLVQIILVGQPALEKKLGDPNASSLAQRVSISYHLLPFSRQEAEEYIVHRLKKSGSRTNPFTPGAIDSIYSATRGIPRSINLLCDNAMAHAFSNRLKTIEAPLIKEVLKENRSRGGRSVPGSPAGLGRTERASSDPTSASSASKAACVKGDLPGWQAGMMRRMDALERLVISNTKEIKALLQKERQRNDKLLIAYTHLKHKYDALLKIQIEKERMRVDMAEKRSMVRSAAAGRRVAQLVPHKIRE